MKKGVLKVMLGSVVLEAIIVCVFILIGKFNDIAWKSLASVANIFLYSIPCLFYARVYDNEKYRNLAVVGTIVVGILALNSILSLWGLLGSYAILQKIIYTLSIVMWALAFISWALSYESVNNLLNLFKKIFISLLSILSLILIIIVWIEKFPEGFFSRLFYVLIVLTFGAFVCILILTRMFKKELINQSNEIEENIEIISNDVIQQVNEVNIEPQSQANTQEQSINVVSNNQNNEEVIEILDDNNQNNNL